MNFRFFVIIIIKLRILNVELCSVTCSYGQKLSRLPRKHFDKFTSEILPCYEYEKLDCVHMGRKVFPGTEISLADRQNSII